MFGCGLRRIAIDARGVPAFSDRSQKYSRNNGDRCREDYVAIGGGEGFWAAYIVARTRLRRLTRLSLSGVGVRIGRGR